MHVAAELGFEEISSLLIAQGAKLRQRNSAGQSPRDAALRSGCEEIVAMIDHALAPGTIV